MINLQNKQFAMFFTPNTESHQMLRVFMVDENTGHFQAAMEPGTQNVYGVLSSSGRIEFNLVTHVDHIFSHFVGAIQDDGSGRLWMAGTLIKFTLQTTGQQSGQPFVLPFYAIQRG